MPVKNNKTPSPASASFDPELLDQLLASCDGAADIVGPNGLLKQFTAAVVERALAAELTAHLGYGPSERRPEGQSNVRNGTTPKTVLTEQGAVPLQIPRDREGSFEPQLVPKHVRRLDGFDDKVLSLYARGMSVRDIRGHLEELYGTEVSPDLISRVTDAVLDEVTAWQRRPLGALWPVVYLDALFVKVRDNGVYKSKAVYVALGVSPEGYKEVLGLWISETEGAKFWMKILDELRSRGVADILIACCDGLTGLPEAIEAVFPRATVQTCIVHQIRNSLKYVAHKDRKAVARDLKPVYTAASEEQALEALEAFDEAWGEQYPTIARSWLNHWARIVPFFAFPAEIRRIIYTTNAIEGLNRQLRKAVKTRGLFPNDRAVFKVLYLAISKLSASWTRPRQGWAKAMQQFAIHFEDRITL